MVSEYKNEYDVIYMDDDIERLQIPEEIGHDTSLKSYLVMNGDKVEAYYERVSTCFDKPAVIVQATLVEKPIFLGRWEDKTEEYIETHKKKKAQKKAQKKDNLDASSKSRPAADRTEELRRAEELLRKLQARFGGDNE